MSDISLFFNVFERNPIFFLIPCREVECCLQWQLERNIMSADTQKRTANEMLTREMQWLVETEENSSSPLQWEEIYRSVSIFLS